MTTDERWMRHVLKLARRGWSHVHPNPMVGAVLIKNNRIVGVGYHRRFGGAHAEVDAIHHAGAKARGATLYVNLEPCSHWGKTPPCADAVVQAGIKRVVCAMRDPNPLVAGRGFRRLKQAGIRVVSGILENEAHDLNRAFFTWITQKRPYITLKAATSLDGKIATRTGESRWITGPEARTLGHRLRAEADAIAVGIDTVLADDPQLSAHHKGRNPVRVIFDSRLRTPHQAHCLDAAAPTWILTTRTPKAWSVSAGRQPPFIQTLPKDRQGHVDLTRALAWLAEKGISHLLVEGGGTLHSAFVEKRLVDEVVWFLSPKIIGGDQAPGAVRGKGIEKLSQALTLRHWDVSRVGGDLCLRGRVS